jgi:MFS family permease
MKYLTRSVWILSVVSLLTDAASEMLYPVMPLYLKSIGFSIVFIGILEGVAEATAGLSKGFFGKWSDASGKRVPFVQAGYALSAVSKPMMALFIYPLWIFFARTLERLGKGLRTGARDALLSEETTAENKGRVFGFHRSMDTLGAVLGPAFALLYLYFNSDDYKTLFFIAFIPGLLAVLVTLLLKEKKRNVMPQPTVRFFSFLGYWKQSPVKYRQLLTGLLAFALFNSSDVFLLLMAKQTGMNDTMLLGVYIFYNLIYALFAFPLGMLADRISLKKMFLTGLFLFATVYFGMASAKSPAVIFFLFFLYGIYAAATEGISKAWITNISGRDHTATAIGLYSAFQSICGLLASSIAGLIWFQFGATVLFLITGTAVLGIGFYFLICVRN